MSDPLRLAAAPTTILDIPLPGQGSWTRAIPVQSREWERTDTRDTPTQPEIPDAVPPGYPPNEVPPTFDYSFHEQVERALQVKLVDLEAWLLLQRKYGTPNLLINSINSDFVILGRPGRVDEVEEF